MDKHNNLITRTFRLELEAVALLDERVRVANHRISDLEKGGSRVNWKVRLRNPVFWVQIVVSAFAAVLAYAGLTAADLTTWESVGALLCNAVRNPYCLFLVLSSVWNAVNAPTTKGVADSERQEVMIRQVGKGKSLSGNEEGFFVVQNGKLRMENGK